MPVEQSPLQFGFLSTAGIGTKVKRAVDLVEGAEVLAVASRTIEKAQAWAEKHQVSKAYGAYDELLADSDINAIYIPLPPAMHAEWTIKAAEAGKHVLCEKPLAANTAEAREMVEACRQNGVQLMDGVMWVHHDRSTAMKKIIDEDLGKHRRVTAAFSFNYGDNVPMQNIRLKPEMAGGCLGDLGYYCIRAILLAFDDLPTRAFAAARFFNGVDFNVSATLWFAGDRMATFDCAFDTCFRKWMEVAGTAGSLVCDDFVLPNSEESSRFWVHGPKKGEHSFGECVQEARMIEHFVAAIRSGELNTEWPEDAIKCMQVCDAVLESARTGQVVDVMSNE
ncbi:MAG: Gfo/Idh/MocA family oxidoreductase [Planctomycetota bacterium]|nr:Gfo/Idh/MocA family oxidoreductase [Planctomycetota bacterium]MDA1142175.1 Gfo/Idh/MocA family oxidoreductase [Planctomycetota bacterium]